MARLWGAGSESLQRFHQLGPHLSRTGNRAPILADLEVFFKPRRLWHLRTFGGNAALEEFSLDSSLKIESSCGNEKSLPSDLSNKDVHVEESSAFGKVEESNVSRGTTGQNSSSPAKPAAAGKPIKGLRELFAEQIHNQKTSSDKQKAQRSFKIDTSKIFTGTSDKAGSTLGNWAQRLAQNFSAANAPRPFPGKDNSFNFQSNLSFKKDADERDDFSDLDHPVEPHEVQAMAGGSATMQSPAPVANLSLEQFLSDSKNSSLGSSSNAYLKSATIKSKAMTKKLYQNNGQSLDKSTKPLDLSCLKVESKSVDTNRAPALPADTSFLNRGEATTRSLKDSMGSSFMMDSGYAVCIRLPAAVDLVNIKEQLSIHGEITGSFKDPGSKGSCTCYIEFDTEEARESAVAGRWVYVNGRQYPVKRADQPMTTVVRLHNVSSETTAGKVLFTCESCGKVDKVTRREDGTFDVYFKVVELANMSRILDSLNEVTLNQSRWRAQPAPLIHPDAKETFVQTKEGSEWLAFQLKQVLKSAQSRVIAMNIGLQDLWELLCLEPNKLSLEQKNQVPGLASRILNVDTVPSALEMICKGSNNRKK